MLSARNGLTREGVFGVFIPVHLLGDGIKERTMQRRHQVRTREEDR
jgi:hypothetical protein